MSEPTPLDPPVLDQAQLVRIEAVHRGFLYQHLYVAHCLLLACETDVRSIVVESDEDVEIVRASGRTYVQVKYRASSLSFSDIKDVLQRFTALRALHATGTRPGKADFVIAANAAPNGALVSRMNEATWPADVRIDWPQSATANDPATPRPGSTLLDAFAQCRALADSLPFGLLAPETLVWKLAGSVMMAAAGAAPRTDHAFQVSELAELFEQLVVQLQDFPMPPAVYRIQTKEPSLVSEQPVRIITGYSGAGKTSWVSQAALHAAGSAVYFDIRDIPGPALATGLARDLAARQFGTGGGRLGEVLLPGASGSEILQGISRRLAVEGQTLTVVLDNAHRPPPADVQSLVRAAPALKFLLLCQPGRETQELEALLQVTPEALGGWSPDTIAAEAASKNCRADLPTCQKLLELTGGLPLYIQNTIAIVAAEYGGSIADFCASLAAQTHTVETTQELILSRIFQALSEGARDTVAVLRLCDVPLTGPEATDVLRGALKGDDSTIASHLRLLRGSGLTEVFGGEKLKIHDAVRLIGQAYLNELGEATAETARRSLRDVLSTSIQTDWDLRKLSLYLRMLAETGDTKTLVQLGTDELFHELGIWPEIRPYLEKAAASEEVDPEQRFWALDGLAFGDMKKGAVEETTEHIALMDRLVEDHALGVDERLAAAMKRMNVLAREGDLDAVLTAMDAITAELKPSPAHQRIFRYNAAVALFHLGANEAAVSEAIKLVNEYYDLIGLSPRDVMGRNADKLRPLLSKTPSLTDDLKHLADCLDLYAMAMTASGRDPALARIHALKFYDLAQAPDSLIRVGQDLVDEFIKRRDFVGARQVIESNILPIVRKLKLFGRTIPVRSQYAVVLAYCGDFAAAEAEMARLAPYEAGLDEQGQGELRDQRRLIVKLRRFGPPPQWQPPASLPRRVGPFPVVGRTKVGRNDPCPCGSGKKYKKCHG